MIYLLWDKDACEMNFYMVKKGDLVFLADSGRWWDSTYDSSEDICTRYPGRCFAVDISWV